MLRCSVNCRQVRAARSKSVRKLAGCVDCMPKPIVESPAKAKAVQNLVTHAVGARERPALIKTLEPRARMLNQKPPAQKRGKTLSQISKAVRKRGVELVMSPSRARD